MKRFLLVLAALFLFFIPVLSDPSVSLAADFRGDETISVGPDAHNLSNLYLFGNTISLDAPVQNDVVAAGKIVNLDGTVSGSIMTAGSTIVMKNTVGNSIRAAGGTITLYGTVSRDFVVAGGDITIDKSASIGGDLIFAGGTLTVNGPVKGKIYVTGGKVILNSTVGQGVNGHIEHLTLGPKAVVHGDLKYSSEQQAAMSPQARVDGKVTFDQQKSKHQDTTNTFISSFVYKLIIDIILSVLFIYFFGKFCLPVIESMRLRPVKNVATGFGFTFLFPIAAVVMLVLIWLGVAAFLIYGLILVISLFLSKIFVGREIMKWYEGRSDKKNVYKLDWKAGVVGAIVFAVVTLIPVLGWLVGGVLFLIAVGALTTYTLTNIKK